MAAVTGIIIAELDGRTPVIDLRDGEYLPRGEDAYPMLFDSSVQLRSATFDDCAVVEPALWSDRIASHSVDVISKEFPNDHSNPFIHRKLSVSLIWPSSAPVALFRSNLPKLARIRARRTTLGWERDHSSRES
jgi:hypothetical protein